MSKMNIEWHEQCLKNLLASVEAKREEVIRVQEDFERLKKNYEKYQVQVRTAKMKKMDGFDTERFMKKDL